MHKSIYVETIFLERDCIFSGRDLEICNIMSCVSD